MRLVRSRRQDCFYKKGPCFWCAVVANLGDGFSLRKPTSWLNQVELYLARNMLLTSIDQLWVADITYIRLRDEFVFLAVILDACSLSTTHAHVP